MALIDDLLAKAKGKCEACGEPFKRRNPAVLSFVDLSAGKRRSLSTSLVVCDQACIALEQLSMRERILKLVGWRDPYSCPTSSVTGRARTRRESKGRPPEPSPVDVLLFAWPPRFSLEETSHQSNAPVAKSKTKPKPKRKLAMPPAEVAAPSPFDAAERTKRVRQFLDAGTQLTYEKLRLILDRLELFEFSPEEILRLRVLLQEEIDGKRYDGMAVYSGTRGQD